MPESSDDRVTESHYGETDAVPANTRRRPDDVVVYDEDRTGLDAARSRYGGLDVPASLAGMLVALAMLLLLAGLVSAAFGAIAFRTGTVDLPGNVEELSVGALISAGVVILLAFLIGGWSAGRMARYSGALNGLMVAVWFVILLLLLAILGALAGDTYNLFGDLRVAEASLPNWFSTDETTAGAILSSIAFAVVMFVGAILGGIWGTRLHRKADRTIAGTSGRRIEERPVVDRDTH